jgi:hypothetical protein
MSDLIAVILAAVPLVAFVVLIVVSIRTGTARAGDRPPVELFYRAYGA